MKEFSIPLKHKYERPIIELYGLSALIDTGAVIPMISEAPTILEEKFFGKKILDNGTIGGIGGETDGWVYSIPNFQIGDLVFENFEVFVPYESDLKFQILLCAPMFYGMSYTFDTIEEKFTVKMRDDQNLKRDFKIKNLKGRLYPQVDGILLQKIDIIKQDYTIFI